MFGIDRARLARNLGLIGARLCGYGGRGLCDCKYALQPSDVGHGEYCGCPEVGMARQMVEAMTDKEFDRIAKRAGVVINTRGLK